MPSDATAQRPQSPPRASLPIASLVSGIDSEKVLDQNLAIVRNFQPMTDTEKRELEARTKELAGDGRYDLFKTSKSFDGPVHRKQHGFSTDEVS